MKTMNEDKQIDIDRFQTEYKAFIESLKEKGCCSEEDRQKMLDLLDRADKIIEDMGSDRKADSVMPMTLRDFIKARPNEDEFTVYDKDYDVEVYFYHPDMSEKWDIAMSKIAGLLTVVDYKEATKKDNPCATVDLSGLIERNINNGVFKDLFIYNTLDAIMDDIQNIFAGYVSDEWLTDFAESLR